MSVTTNRKPSPRQTVRPPTPPALADVAMIDGPSSAAGAGESISKFLDGVRRTERGELSEFEVPYPLPVIRQPRFTRWRLVDVREWLIKRAESGADPQAAANVAATAKKASAAAKVRRGPPAAVR